MPWRSTPSQFEVWLVRRRRAESPSFISAPTSCSTAMRRSRTMRRSHPRREVSTGSVSYSVNGSRSTRRAGSSFALKACLAPWPDGEAAQGRSTALSRASNRGRDVRVFTDRVVSPSYVHDVARAVRHLLMTNAPPGVYHCVNSGHATWHEVAEETARLLGAQPRLQPVRMDQAAFKAARPRFCALANRKLAAAGFMMPTWNDSLRRWLTERSARQDKIGTVHG